MNIQFISTLASITTAITLIIVIIYLYTLRKFVKNFENYFITEYKKLFHDYDGLYKSYENLLSKIENDKSLIKNLPMDTIQYEKASESLNSIQNKSLNIATMVNKNNLFGKESYLIADRFITLNNLYKNTFTDFFSPSSKRDILTLENDLRTLRTLLNDLDFSFHFRKNLKNDSPEKNSLKL